MKLVGRRLLAWLCSARSTAILATIPAACAVGIWFSWVNDNAVLRERAVAVTAGLGGGFRKKKDDNHLVFPYQDFYKERPLFFLSTPRPYTHQGHESEWGDGR